MTDAGFFKGTSAEQDARFADKKKKLMKTMKFGDNLSQKVDMTRVNLDCIKPWIMKRITELLNFEDEVVWDYVLNQLEERYPDPKEIQINITGFLNSKNARIFLTELWDLMLSAMQNPDGVPAVLLEAKKAEIANRQVDEKQVQMELRRKQEELRIKSAAAQLSQTPAPLGVTVQQSLLPQRPVSNGSKNESTDVLSRTSQPVDSKGGEPRSASSSPARRHDPETSRTKSPAKSDSDRKRRHKDRRSRRSRDSSSSSVSSAEDGSRGRHGSRHRHRSRSAEVVVKKQPVPDSDWRKDLMAGRRRSPPQMPENSYYGYEKHRREHKRSKHRRRSSDHDDASDDGYHRSHHSHSRSSRRRGDSPSRRARDDSHRESKYYERRATKPKESVDPAEDPARRYRERRGHYDNRSPSVGSPRGGYSLNQTVDRANKHHDRRAQWAQEEDEVTAHIPVKDASSRHAKQKSELVSDRHPQRPSGRARSRSIEGPSLPNSMAERVDPSKKIPPKPMSESSSEASGSESSSSDEESSSGSDSSDTSDDDAAAPVPEGPPLPPGALKKAPEPEGPALPPSIASAPPRTNQSSTVAKAGSSTASESSSDDDASGSSSDSDSDSGSSSSSSQSSSGSEDDEKESAAPPHKRKRNENDSTLAKPALEHHHRKRVPEGPPLSSTHASESHSHRKHPSSDSKKFPEMSQRKSKREDSAEEALRRRALASLMRAAGDRRRRRSSRSS